MTRMKIRDRENRKILTGFRDMADFFTGNRDLIPSPGGPLAIRTQRWRGKEGVAESRDQPLRKFWGERMVRTYSLHKGKKIGILPLSYGKL